MRRPSPGARGKSKDIRPEPGATGGREWLLGEATADAPVKRCCGDALVPVCGGADVAGQGLDCCWSVCVFASYRF